MKNFKEFNESRDEYTLYHDSLTSAVQEIERYVQRKGYTLDEDEMAQEVALGPRKPSKGKTNKYNINLYKHGKEQRKALHFKVYNRGTHDNKYELTAHIS